MSILFEMLKIADGHIGDAAKARIAFEDGLITVGEWIAIANLAIGWLDLAVQFYGMEIDGPSNP